MHADRAPLLFGLRVPLVFQRRLARGHGFSMREVEEKVRPAVALTPFGRVSVARSGACLRFELRKGP